MGLSSLNFLLPVAQHYMMSPCDMVEKYIGTHPLKIFNYLYNERSQLSASHRRALALWALQKKNIDCSRLTPGAWSAIYNRGDKDVVAALAEKDSTIAAQVQRYEESLKEHSPKLTRTQRLSLSIVEYERDHES